MATGLSISSYISQVVAGQPRKPSPIHDALQAIQNWAAAGLTANDLAANAGILASQTELGTYTAPTSSPFAITAVTTNPTQGNGTWNCVYTRVGKLVTFHMTFIFGSTSTAGSGAYLFTLPVASAYPMTVPVLMFQSATGVGWRGLARLDSSGTSLVRVYLNDATAVLAHNAPWSWAPGDFIYMTGSYITS
jgi:hypothetical protein